MTDVLEIWREGLNLSRSRKYDKAPLIDRQWRIHLSRVKDWAAYSGKSPEELIEEAKRDPKKVEVRISKFYQYKKKEGLTSGSARTVCNSIQGFYKHNRVVVRYVLPTTVSEDKITESRREPYIIKNEAGEYRLRPIIKDLFDSLDLPYRTVALCCLSSSEYPSDLFALNMDFILDRDASQDVFYWVGQRYKTNQLFNTFLSREAVAMLRRYVKIYRSGAKADEPLFVLPKRPHNRMTTKSIQDAFRLAAKKIGLVNGSGETPITARDLRHIFRDACDAVSMPSSIASKFMGHSESVNEEYAGRFREKMKDSYLLIEPILTVYGSNQVNNNDDRIPALQALITNQAQELEQLKSDLAVVSSLLDNTIEELDIAKNPEAWKEFLKWSESQYRPMFKPRKAKR